MLVELAANSAPAAAAQSPACRRAPGDAVAFSCKVKRASGDDVASSSGSSKPQKMMMHSVARASKRSWSNLMLPQQTSQHLADDTLQKIDKCNIHQHVDMCVYNAVLVLTRPCSGGPRLLLKLHNNQPVSGKGQKAALAYLCMT